MNILTLQQAQALINSTNDFIQLFTRDYKYTFFLSKEEYEKEQVRSLIRTLLVANLFDYGAYWYFVCNTTKTAFADLESLIQRMRPGIVVGTEETLLQYLDTYHFVPTCASGNREFDVNHFPKGTLVTVSGDLHSYRIDAPELYPSVFYVNKVIQNDANSYFLETLTYDKSSFAEKGEYYGFNMSHVDTIVLRGNGGLVVDRYPLYNEGMKGAWDASPNFPDLTKKNHWLAHTAVYLVMMIVSKLSRREGAIVDYYNLADHLVRQAFVKDIKIGAAVSGFTVYLFSINKKRAKRFVAQNINRFLISARKQQAKKDDQEMHDLERMYDLEY